MGSQASPRPVRFFWTGLVFSDWPGFSFGLAWFFIGLAWFFIGLAWFFPASQEWRVRPVLSRSGFFRTGLVSFRTGLVFLRTGLVSFRRLA